MVVSSVTPMISRATLVQRSLLAARLLCSTSKMIRCSVLVAVADLPVGVGVGVSTGAQAAAMSEHADGIIVGTAFVRTLLDHADDRDAALGALRTLTEELAGGVRRA